MSGPDDLRAAVDLAGLGERCRAGPEPEVVLAWWSAAQATALREVTAGRATVADAAVVQQEALDVMAVVPGLQFVTNERWGVD